VVRSLANALQIRELKAESNKSINQAPVNLIHVLLRFTPRFIRVERCKIMLTVLLAYCSLRLAVVARPLYRLGIKLFRQSLPAADPPESAPPFATKRSLSITVLENSMTKNTSYLCRVRLVRAGLSRARRARARVRRQRLLMFKVARSN